MDSRDWDKLGLLQLAREYRRLPHIDEAGVCELSRRIRENGDRQAFAELVESHLRFVVSHVWRIMRRFGYSTVSLQDAVQLGSLGLMEAAVKYDPTRGVKFTSYAFWWIRRYIQHGVMKEGFTLRYPTNVLELRRRMRMAEKSHQSRYGYRPTREELMKILCVTERQFQAAELTLSHSIAIAYDDTDAAVITRRAHVPISHISSEDHFVIRETRDHLVDELQVALIPARRESVRNRQMFRMRYGINDNLFPVVMEDVAREFGVTRQRVKQVMKQVFATMPPERNEEWFRDTIERIEYLSCVLGTPPVFEEEK